MLTTPKNKIKESVAYLSFLDVNLINNKNNLIKMLLS